ncbi:hypothetical protein DFP72DRAFT_858508 [Ephemerocybe angulata]|uniref:Uncharacterized protein n=1 Tax=Ephemerocybe angulata TaxID=980116 RepID=A0A8H6LWE5_9AGAR|nr:hypothetical protein DFP72DRAFT_858508 [Tulosesus angulatus]
MSINIIESEGKEISEVVDHKKVQFPGENIVNDAQNTQERRGRLTGANLPSSRLRRSHQHKQREAPVPARQKLHTRSPRTTLASATPRTKKPRLRLRDSPFVFQPQVLRHSLVCAVLVLRRRGNGLFRASGGSMKFVLFNGVLRFWRQRESCMTSLAGGQVVLEDRGLGYCRPWDKCVRSVDKCPRARRRFGGSRSSSSWAVIFVVDHIARLQGEKMPRWWDWEKRESWKGTGCIRRRRRDGFEAAMCLLVMVEVRAKRPAARASQPPFPLLLAP